MRIGNKNRRGFTLIELIIGMAMFGIIAVVITSFEAQFEKITLFINQSIENRQGFDSVFQSLRTEIRSAGSSAIGGYTIESATSTSFVFFSDVDGDGVTERIRYTITPSSTLERGFIDPSGSPLTYATSSETKQSVITNVVATSSSFQYYDSNYSGTQNPMSYPIDVSLIRMVKITVTADVNPTASPLPVTFSHTINIRNLRTN